jgi:hypothetical protein
MSLEAIKPKTKQNKNKTRQKQNKTKTKQDKNKTRQDSQTRLLFSMPEVGEH